MCVGDEPQGNPWPPRGPPQGPTNPTPTPPPCCASPLLHHDNPVIIVSQNQPAAGEGGPPTKRLHRRGCSVSWSLSRGPRLCLLRCCAFSPFLLLLFPPWCVPYPNTIASQSNTRPAATRKARAERPEKPEPRETSRETSRETRGAPFSPLRVILWSPFPSGSTLHAPPPLEGGRVPSSLLMMRCLCRCISPPINQPISSHRCLLSLIRVQMILTCTKQSLSSFLLSHISFHHTPWWWHCVVGWGGVVGDHHHHTPTHTHSSPLFSSHDDLSHHTNKAYAAAPRVG